MLELIVRQFYARKSWAQLLTHTVPFPNTQSRLEAHCAVDAEVIATREVHDFHVQFPRFS